VGWGGGGASGTWGGGIGQRREGQGRMRAVRHDCVGEALRTPMPLRLRTILRRGSAASECTASYARWFFVVGIRASFWGVPLCQTATVCQSESHCRRAQSLPVARAASRRCQ
jgi:hypothetical protein